MDVRWATEAGNGGDRLDPGEGPAAESGSPGRACHYYIHAIEASPNPERALNCAKRLPELMPGTGHLVHMPAHIYMRVGRYREASERNARAAEVDQRYLDHRKLTGSYPTGYYLHNVHFLLATLTMEGRSAETLRVARELVGAVSAEEVRKDLSLEAYTPAVLLTLARFGKWADVIREAPPSKWAAIDRGPVADVRGLVLATTGRISGAEAEHHTLEEMIKGLPRDRTQAQKTNRLLLKIAERVLAGELAAKRTRYDNTIRAIKKAVRVEETLPYAEPPLWYQPVRQNLGTVLLAAGRATAAEAAYREDLKRNPENGWALHGLVQSLRAQNKVEDAAAVEERFRQAWSQPISRSRTLVSHDEARPIHVGTFLPT